MRKKKTFQFFSPYKKKDRETEVKEEIYLTFYFWGKKMHNLKEKAQPQKSLF